MTVYFERFSKINIRILAYATVLVAFFLRAYRLADMNIWWDEGWSVWLSQKDLASIALRTAADEHPPLHYWILHFWNMLTGTDAFAGRFISLVFGVLTIALLYRIGRRVGGAWIGVLAAFFLATARFHVWWSQDIKNYTPSIFFAFAAIWFALGIIASSQSLDSASLRSGPRLARTILGYSVCAALALWTHYLAALVLLALNLYALIVIVIEAADRGKISETPGSARRNRKIRLPCLLVNWVIANLLAAALFAPWMYLYLQNASAWSAAPVFDFSLFLKLVATVLPLGVTTNIDNYAALTVAMTVIAAVPVFSILYSAISRRKAEAGPLPPNTRHWLLFTLIVALPPILLYVLSLTPISFFAPKIQARYLLVLLPAYTILLALGVATIKRFSNW
ncbi:MAG TPA: glycosyltransferase family 39 protein, partial [Anaerolineae bacterium]